MLPARFALPGRVLGLLLAAALGTSCASPPPELEALASRPDFSRPEETGRTFLVSWAVHAPKTEYEALSEAWKDEVGGTLDAYLLARPQLQAEVGWISSQAWRLQPIRTEAGAEGVLTWWGLDPERDPVLGIECVPQNYLEFEEAGARDRTPGSYFDEELEQFYGIEGSLLWVEIEDSAVREASRLDGIRSIKLGTEWKIRRLIPWDPPADEDDAGADARAGNDA